MPRTIRHVLGHMTGLTSLLVSRPVLGQGQAEVEQGMIVAGHVPHVDTHLAVVNLSPVATPLPFHPNRVGAPLWEAAGIEGNDAIGFTQSIDHLSDQHLDQWPVVPGRRANEVLHDQALDIDQGSNLFGTLAWQMGQQAFEVEVDIALACLGREGLRSIT
jgi:hypothetical protein